MLLTSDLDEVVSAASEAQHPLRADLSRPRDPLEFEIRHRPLRSMDLTFARLDYHAGYRVDGAAPESHYHLSLPLAGESEMICGSRSVGLSGGRWGILLPPGRPLTCRSDRGFEEFTLNLDRELLEGHLEALSGKAVRAPIRFDPRVDLRQGPGAALLRLVLSLVEAVDAGAPEHATAELEESVQDAVLFGLDHDRRDLVDGLPAAATIGTVRAAEDYLEAHADHPLPIEEVANALGVSIRTLQRSFRRHRGCTPRRHLKRVRLARAQELLLRGAPGTTVTAAAMRSGFSHLGQFSVDYRRQFSESPSHTLRRTRGLSLPR